MLSIFAAILLQISSSFWSYWGDGKAELNRYKTIQNRYDEDRNAEVILIYVTEPFNLEKQVKSDSYNLENKNHAQVLKLNRIKDFQTGIYDYNLMSSVFTSIDPFKLNNKNFSKGEVIKITFTGQDWCGHVFHQLNRQKNDMLSKSFSYFESESDQEEHLSIQNNTLFADNLFIDVRELFRKMPAGEISFYSSLENSRLFHVPLSLKKAKIEKTNSKYSFDNNEVAVTIFQIISNNESWKFIVEKEYPRKILSYENKLKNKTITKGTLIKSVRLPYWKLNNPGNEEYLKELGY